MERVLVQKKGGGERGRNEAVEVIKMLRQEYKSCSCICDRTDGWFKRIHPLFLFDSCLRHRSFMSVQPCPVSVSLSSNMIWAKAQDPRECFHFIVAVAHVSGHK